MANTDRIYGYCKKETFGFPLPRSVRLGSAREILSQAKRNDLPIGVMGTSCGTYDDWHHMTRGKFFRQADGGEGKVVLESVSEAELLKAAEDRAVDGPSEELRKAAEILGAAFGSDVVRCFIEPEASGSYVIVLPQRTMEQEEIMSYATEKLIWHASDVRVYVSDREKGDMERVVEQLAPNLPGQPRIQVLTKDHLWHGVHFRQNRWRRWLSNTDPIIQNPFVECRFLHHFTVGKYTPKIGLDVAEELFEWTQSNAPNQWIPDQSGYPLY